MWVASVAALAAAIGLTAGSAQGQELRDPSLVRVSAFAAASLREGPTGLGVGRDVLSVTARVTWPRRGIQPWAQVGAFTRPNLSCLPGLRCNSEGWTALAGVALPFSRDDTQPGVQSYLLGGVGVGVSEETTAAYLVGVGSSLVILPRVAPSLEVRWEHLPGIRNVVMLNLGVRIDLF